MIRVSVYCLSQLKSKVQLLPSQISSDIDESLLENLKLKIEGKGTRDGIVIKVLRIVDYEYGVVDRLTFSGTINYYVTYECMLCSPSKDSEIVCKVENFFKGFIICSNGPITIAINMNQIDTDKFSVSNMDSKLTEIDTKKDVTVGSLVRVSIISYKLELGSNSICALGKLLNIATTSDQKTYEKEQTDILDNRKHTDNIFI